MTTKNYLLFDGTSYFVSAEIEKNCKVVAIDYNLDILQAKADRLNTSI